VQVLEVLEAVALAASRKLTGFGRAISFLPRYYAHPSAVIDKGAQIGRGHQDLALFSHHARFGVGTNCNLGQNVSSAHASK